MAMSNNPYNLRANRATPEEFSVSTNFLGPYDKPCSVQIANIHPLKVAQDNMANNEFNLQLNILRQVQGIAGPLNYIMELKSVQKPMHLPFLPSSNFSHDVLTGRGDTIELGDYLGVYDALEMPNQPHAVMERISKF